MKKTLVCPLCKQTNLIHIFSKKSLPKYNLVRYYDRESALKTLKREVAFYFCKDCLFAFNAAFNASEMDYAVDYESSRASSEYFNKYLNQVFQRLEKTFSITGKTIVEVGCGDGQFLKKLREKYEFNGYGYDSNLNTDLVNQSANKQDLHFVQGCYKLNSLKTIPNLIVLRHILEHQKNPYLFFDTMLPKIKTDDAVNIYIEVPAWEWIIDNNWIFALCYEHCSYYSQFSIKKVMNSYNYATKKTLFGFGNEYLQYYGSLKKSQSLVKDNKALRQYVIKKSLKFGYLIPHTLDSLRTYLDGFLDKAVLWGAAGKGTVFLNTLNIDYKRLSYVIDSNPNRHGTYIPGTGQQVVAPEFLKKLKPEYILLTNSAYRNEIISQIKKLNLKAQLVPIDEFLKELIK